MGKTLTELMSASISNAIVAQRAWDGIIILANNYGAESGEDSTEAIQKAINDAKEKGKSEVYFQPGTYSYTSLSGTEGIVFVGDGVIVTGGTPAIPVVSTAQLADIAAYGFVKQLTQQDIDDGYAKGTLRLPAGNFIVSNLNIESSLTIEGNGIDRTVIIVESTLNNVGFHVSANRVNFKNLTFLSTGSKTDGNNVRGVLFDRGSGNIGYNDHKSIKGTGFSGCVIEYVNPIDVSIDRIHTGNNAVGIKTTNAYGVSGGTTMDIKDLYSGMDTTGIQFDKTTTSVLIRPIIEQCDTGIVATNCTLTVYSPYFEGVDTYDMELTDTIMTRLGDGRTDKGNRITWVSQGSSSRAGNEFSRYNVAMQKLIMYYVRGLSEKEITPYRFINNDDDKWTDGVVFDANRVIPFVAPNNLLSPTGWNYPFHTSKKAVEIFRSVVGDAEYCVQTVNLTQGNYEFIAALETTGTNGIARTGTFSVIDSSNNVIYNHDLNPAGNQSDNRFQRLYERFTIEDAGDYTIRIRVQNTPARIFMFGPCLYRTDRTVSPFTSYDEAMRNSFIMLGHLSGIQSGYNYMGDGNKVEYGASAPSTGTYKVGDKVKNTTPTAGGYMGWVCITAGSPGTWKGYGLIEA